LSKQQKKKQGDGGSWHGQSLCGLNYCFLSFKFLVSVMVYWFALCYFQSRQQGFKCKVTLLHQLL